MQLLDAVNSILPKLGERPVTSLESHNPTLGVILPEIKMGIDTMCMTGWWFNTFHKVDLFPNSEGYIDVPEDTLSFVPDIGQVPMTARGERFYNAQTRSYKFTDKVRGTLRQRLPFQELPESAAAYVLYESLVVIYATDIGLEQVVDLWRNKASQAQASMEQEHLRHKNYSVRQQRQYSNLRNAMRY